MHDIEKITIALAGIIQAASLVKELAQTGKIHESGFETSIYSLFQTDPVNIENIYKNLSGLSLGFEKIILLFSNNSASEKNLTRYVLSIIHLQKKIFNSQQLVDMLTKRIHQAKKQAEYFSITHPTVLASLADIYLTLIRHMRFRIVVWGNQKVLTTNDNMDKIRALLLAGIRSALLWRQMGGSRLHLLFARKQITLTAKKLLVKIKTQDFHKELV